MFSTIEDYCQGITADFSNISANRKKVLDKIAHYINEKGINGKGARLVYICTHNSRRSHFGQIWSHVAAVHYKISGIFTFSGGTEATAFNVNAIEALKRIGFKISPINEGSNPEYEIHYGGNDLIHCFSKRYDSPVNPVAEFAAIMTCSEADTNCPFIPGAELRVATPYEDPKNYDGLAEQEMRYDQCCRTIATETFYIFSTVKSMKK